MTWALQERKPSGSFVHNKSALLHVLIHEFLCLCRLLLPEHVLPASASESTLHFSHVA